MKKRELHHIWRKIHILSYWYFFAAFLVFAGVAVFALRQNNLNAIKLRDNVSEVDKANGDVEAALKQLREYVYGHMNTNLSTGTSIQQPVQLKYRYERLVAAEKVRVEAENSKIYSDAQSTCEKLYPGSFSGGPRVPCIESYVTTHGAKQQPITDALYKFNFESPRWSMDLAGVSIVLSALFFVLFVLRFLIERWLRSVLKQHL